MQRGQRQRPTERHGRQGTAQTKRQQDSAAVAAARREGSNRQTPRKVRSNAKEPERGGSITQRKQAAPPSKVQPNTAMKPEKSRTDSPCPSVFCHEEIESVFDRMDYNGNGGLSLAEIDKVRAWCSCATSSLFTHKSYCQAPSWQMWANVLWESARVEDVAVAPDCSGHRSDDAIGGAGRSRALP